MSDVKGVSCNGKHTQNYHLTVHLRSTELFSFFQLIVFKTNQGFIHRGPLTDPYRVSIKVSLSGHAERLIKTCNIKKSIKSVRVSAQFYVCYCQVKKSREAVEFYK